MVNHSTKNKVVIAPYFAGAVNLATKNRMVKIIAINRQFQWQLLLSVCTWHMVNDA